MLEEHYTGDENWFKFVSAFPSHNELKSDSRYLRLLKEVNDQEDLARVIFETCPPNHLVDWVDGEIPALNGLTPRECLQGRFLLRLRVCLMRFPR